MTTIIVKNRDFSAGNFVHYVPPVDGAEVFSFVGGNDNLFVKNFGSLNDLDVGAGAGTPVVVDDVYRRFNQVNWLVTPATRSTATTILAVHRDVAPIAAHGILIGNDRQHADGGRRGMVLSRSSTDKSVLGWVNGTSGGTNVGPASTLAIIPGDAAFTAAIVKPTATTGAQLKVAMLSNPQQFKAYVANTEATIAPAADEAAFPFRVGRHYRAAGGDIDIGFVAVYPRELTDVELQKIYASVKKRFAAFGVAI